MLLCLQSAASPHYCTCECKASPIAIARSSFSECSRKIYIQKEVTFVSHDRNDISSISETRARRKVHVLMLVLGSAFLRRHYTHWVKSGLQRGQKKNTILRSQVTVMITAWYRHNYIRSSENINKKHHSDSINEWQYKLRHFWGTRNTVSRTYSKKIFLVMFSWCLRKHFICR